MQIEMSNIPLYCWLFIVLVYMCVCVFVVASTSVLAHRRDIAVEHYSCIELDTQTIEQPQISLGLSRLNK